MTLVDFGQRLYRSVWEPKKPDKSMVSRREKALATHCYAIFTRALNDKK